MIEKNNSLDKINVVGDRVLVKPRKESEKTDSGLYLPPGVREKEKVQYGYIVKSGPGYPIPIAVENDQPWKSDDEKIRDRMMKNAQTVANRGMDAILALMGRGVGEATCQRLMRKVQRGDKEALLEAIHIAETEYARTRRFWG